MIPDAADADGRQTPTGTDPPFQVSDIPATAEGVRAALIGLRASLLAQDLSEEECWTVEMALAEAMNNIVEHAYGPALPGVIGMRLRMGPMGLEIRIEDSGCEMPGGAPPFGRPADPALPIPDQPEGGFGWFMIREVAHDIAYRRVAGRNILTFRIAVGPRRPGPGHRA